MVGTLIPPWWQQTPPRQADVILATFCWGFMMAVALFCCGKASHQTTRARAHSRRTSAYIVMIWTLWVVNILLGLTGWLYIMGWVSPRCA